MCNFNNYSQHSFVVIINKQVDRISFTFNLNVEFNEIRLFKRKNPLTIMRNVCIIKSASKTIANINTVRYREGL